jgi:starch phosphorylase
MSIIDPVCGMFVDPETTEFKVERWGKIYYFCNEFCLHSFLEDPRIAYFSMEIGIKNEIPTYSGGLGVLAGDTIRSSADLKIPLVALTLLSRKGYLKQTINEKGEQLEYSEEWDPSRFMKLLPTSVYVQIQGRSVKIRTWFYDHQSPTGGVVPILFLDTSDEENAFEDRMITDNLYGGDAKNRLKQEIVLGIGGVKMLKALNFKIKKCHMNEGHSSLLTLELLKDNEMRTDRVKNLCVFTTHTPVEAAFDKHSYDLVYELLGNEYPLELSKEFAGQENLNMTLLALNLSRAVNGVAKSHMNHSKKLFPGYQISAITNGVYSYMWTCPHFRELYDKYLPGWANEPELLVRVDSIPDDEIWDAHMAAKNDLILFVRAMTGKELDPNTLTLGFARRATGYKRATLIFSDLKRLKNVNKRGKLQLIFAGKAHPRDLSGKGLIKEIYKYGEQLKDEISIVYLENYNMNIASKLTSGVDVWLNTPLPPLEASGTSGMKAAHNGVINFSVLDGWWLEGCIEDVTGWSIGPSPHEVVGDEETRTRELDDLYSKMEYIIIPKFYKMRDQWITLMQSSIGKIAYYFNSHRMMRRYVTEAYL